jgi:Na+/melibiose symporter-like transporter
MKKNKLLIIIFIIFVFLLFEGNVFADTALDICNDNDFLLSMRLIGYFIFVVKILVPLLIMIFATIEFGKAITAGKDDGINKAATHFFKKCLIGISIFFIPTFLSFVFSLIDGFSDNKSGYEKCTTCVTNPGDCEVK